MTPDPDLVGPWRPTVLRGRGTGPYRVYAEETKLTWYVGLGFLTALVLVPLGLLSYWQHWLVWLLVPLLPAVDVAAVYWMTRVFRGPQEPAAPRPRWKATADTASSRFFYRLFLVSLALDLVWLGMMLADHDRWVPVRVAGALGTMVLALFYRNSWKRMEAGDLGQEGRSPGTGGPQSCAGSARCSREASSRP